MKKLFRISGIILLILSIFLLFSCKKDKPTSPIISTTAVTEISYTTASSGGDVANEGGAPVIAKGICWDTLDNPTIAKSKTSDGTGTGSFTSSLTQLTPNTKYYVKAYATNSAGTGYGNQISFTTQPAPILNLTTADLTNITQTTATSGGILSSVGTVSITARGVCWSTDNMPNITNNKTNDGAGVGTYSSLITGLISGKTYYIRAYATYDLGTTYGNELIINPTIGKSFCSGIIFYVDATGQHGLIGASNDQASTIEWGCNGTAINGADGTVVGTGSQNTTDILIGCSDNNITDSPAARICRNYTGGGYNDWYLPSKDELYLLYLHKTIFVTNIYTNAGGFESSSNAYYWSSSEIDNFNVWAQSFYTGNKETHSKYGIYKGRVRAIRAF